MIINIFQLFFFLLVNTNLLFAAQGALQPPCEVNLSEPRTIQELIKLKSVILTTKDRITRLLLTKNFQEKVLEISKKMGISEEELLTKISSNKIFQFKDSILTTKTQTPIEVLNEMMVGFKNNYSDFDKMEKTALNFVERQRTGLSPRLGPETNNYWDDEPYPHVYRNSLIAFVMASLKEGKIIDWPYRHFPPTRIFTQAVLASDVTAARTILKLGQLDKKLAVEINFRLSTRVGMSGGSRNIFSPLLAYIEKISNPDVKMVKFLIEEFESDPLQTDKQNSIILTHLFLSKDRDSSNTIKIFNYLIQICPELFISDKFYANLVNSNSALSPLHHMSNEELQWATSVGINVNVFSGTGRTLLHDEAVYSKNIERVRILLEGGANPNLVFPGNVRATQELELEIERDKKMGRQVDYQRSIIILELLKKYQ